MNTTAKGNKFEKRVAFILKKLLKNKKMEILLGDGVLWVVPEKAVVTCKDNLKYPWGSNVVNDITLKLDDEKLKNVLICVECKNYKVGNAVDISEIAEFNTRIQDLKATKGVMITASYFQSGAIKMAKAHNIALIRVSDDNKIQWDLHRVGSMSQTEYSTFVSHLTNKNPLRITAIVDGFECYTSLPDYFCVLFDKQPEYIGKLIPFKTDQEIKSIVDDFKLHQTFPVISDQLLLFFAKYYQIHIQEVEFDDKICGQYDFGNNVISMSSSLKSIPYRYRFTLAHELGHAFMHRQLLRGIIETADDYDIEEVRCSFKWEQRLEYQANLFASYLLIPEEPLLNLYFQFKGELGYKLTEKLFLDTQPCNIKDCHKMFDKLSRCFGVSKHAIRIRLIKEKLLDVSSLNNVENGSIVHVIKEIEEGDVFS